MATYDSDVIAEGALSSSEASIHSPGVGAYLANGCLVLEHTGSVDRVVNIYITKASGTKRLVDKVTMGPTTNIYQSECHGIHLGPSDDLRGAQDAGTDIVYVLMGGAGA